MVVPERRTQWRVRVEALRPSDRDFLFSGKVGQALGLMLYENCPLNEAMQRCGVGKWRQREEVKRWVYGLRVFERRAWLIGLSERTANCLLRQAWHGDYWTKERLIAATDQELLAIRNFGARSLTEVHRWQSKQRQNLLAKVN